MYFEDLNRTPNAEIGPKGLLEIDSTGCPAHSDSRNPDNPR